MLTVKNRIITLLCLLVTLFAQTYSVSSVASMSVPGSSAQMHIADDSVQPHGELMAGMDMLCQDMTAAEAMNCCAEMDTGNMDCCDCNASCASVQCASSAFTTSSAGLDASREHLLAALAAEQLPVQAPASLYRPPITH